MPKDDASSKAPPPSTDKPGKRKTNLVYGLLLILLACGPRDDVVELVEAPSKLPEAGFARVHEVLPAKGKVEALVVYAQFGPSDQNLAPLPSFADQLFDKDKPGSLAHFYDAMSFGQLQISGTVLPKRYVSRRGAKAYLANAKGEDGRYGQFVLEIVQKVDAEIDFSRYDNDGPDGIPNSGDDDNIVDYLFVNVRKAPRDFVFGGIKATGIAGLGFSTSYATEDLGVNGKPIYISSNRSQGALLQQGGFAHTAGVMAHEFGHSLGLTDLYDADYPEPAEDSAGIGDWGLMGDGANGWNGNDGPNPFSPGNLEWLGWLSVDQGNLLVVEDDLKDLRITDWLQGGKVVKVPLGAKLWKRLREDEYLLLEYRDKGTYYNRKQPASGLLVWHVRPYASLRHNKGANDREEHKLIDLVCADGLYTDGGFPLGKTVASLAGGDNLDFWSRDSQYSGANRGNKGDATDVFDGKQFTALTMDTNPSSNIGGLYDKEAATSAALTNMRQQGNGILVDIALPRWAGTIHGEVHWIGDILVDGDLTVAPDGVLHISDKGTRVRFAGQDRLAGGLDPQRCELKVEGQLIVGTRRVYRINRSGGKEPVEDYGITLAALEPGQSWYGIVPGPDATIDIPEGSMEIRDVLNTRLALAQQEGEEVATAVEEDRRLATSHALEPNYPNPFNPQTTIPYQLAEESPVQLVIYNIQGQTVRTLVDQVQSAGSHQVVWDGRDRAGQEVATGVYNYRLQVGSEFVQTRKMTLMR